MLKNIQPRTHDYVEEYRLSYYWNDCPGAGFSFPCTRDGKIIEDQLMTDLGMDNYISCRDGIFDVTFEGIINYSKTMTSPAYGECDCGRTVYLDYDYGHGIDCECGRIYNLSGQELAPRSQWEERYDEDSTAPYNVEFGYANDY